MHAFSLYEWDWCDTHILSSGTGETSGSTFTRHSLHTGGSQTTGGTGSTRLSLGTHKNRKTHIVIQLIQVTGAQQMNHVGRFVSVMISTMSLRKGEFCWS